jgi:hypothetical protein
MITEPAPPVPPRTGRTRRRRGAAIGFVMLAAVVWWAWPSLASHDDRLGVLVVADPFLDPARRSLELRTRESGRTIHWSASAHSSCAERDALARVLEDEQPEQVVLSASCANALAGAPDTVKVIAVVEPDVGPSPALLAAQGYEVVDPERLIGRPGGDHRLTCQWWETCDGDGRIAVRDASGALTVAGHERLARMIVAAL